jgi:hypothetical protein
MEANDPFNPMDDPQIDELIAEQLVDFTSAFTTDKVI